MSSLDVLDIEWLEFLVGQGEEYSPVVGEGVDGRVRAGEVSPEGGEPNRVQEMFEGYTAAVQLDGDGPIAATGLVEGIGRADVGLEKSSEVLAASHALFLARCDLEALRFAARRRASSLDSLSR
jgi:hypothetical protein